MATAQEVIDKFGGQSALARLIKKGPSTVRYWARAGTIPPKWHEDLLRLAVENGIDLQPQELAGISSMDAVTRLPPRIPRALWDGELEVGDELLPCYVLDDGRRVVSRTGATSYLTKVKAQGSLETYLRVEALRNYLADDIADQLVEFTIPEVTHKQVMGLTAETFLEICRAYVMAREDGALQTERQGEIARQASLFLAACSKVGLIALIDEATGYQYQRDEDALRVKLRLFLEEEMREWEKTFPDELWREFGRLTNWEGSVNKRPKYWGKLVMELVYGYLDRDVAEWLKNNAPAPRKGQNYHQWLSSQYGLKKLMEHIWMLIGMASSCETMSQLRQMMADRHGRQGVLFMEYIDPPMGSLPPATSAK